MDIIGGMERVRANGKMVLIQQDDRETEFKTGNGVQILKAETYTYKPRRGVVMSIGGKVPAEMLELKVGSRVVYKPYAGMDMYADDGSEFKIIRWEDIEAVEEN